MRELSLAQARRIALVAQGFGRPRPTRPVTMRDVQATIDQLAQFQIDSVNILARAHLVPLYSRLGAYDTQLLRRASSRAPRRLFEYWGHAASLVDVRLEPALRWRMAGYAQRHPWGYESDPGLAGHCLDEVRRRGPLTPRQVEHEEERSREHWGWNWSATKRAMEWLHSSGQLAAAGRNDQFERLFDLPERVLPAAVVATPTPTREQAQAELVRRSARALGIGSERCLADYFRLSRADTRAAVASLVASGELEEVCVTGWPRRVWLWRGEGARAAVPRQVRTRALVSPFDSLVFERTRARELLGLDYTIEIYVPAARRRHGYYVYPFLLDEHFEARVDLKADRAGRRLLVRATWREADGVADDARVARELAAELRELAGWLGLVEVEVDPVGDFHAALQTATAAPTP